MSSKVFGISLRAHYKESLPQKLVRLFKSLDPQNMITPQSLWAIKIHFGERGSHAFIRPHLVRPFVDAVKELKGKPFLTDTNTLYVGYRTNSADHLETAILNGFDFAVSGAPLVIADGLKGDSHIGVEIEQQEIKTAYIGSDFVAADGVLALTHFKGHEMAGFGGALKNLAMGAASRRGKMDQHSDLSPTIKAKKCISCGACLKSCAHGAISLNAAKKAQIDQGKCVGCAYCIPVCREGAIGINFNTSGDQFMRKMMEYTLASLKNKPGKAMFVNFVTAVSPNCDCANHSDAPIVPDIGILASCDPVALDSACARLVNDSRGLPGTVLDEKAQEPGADKWRAMHPTANWEYQLEYAEQIGLGSRDYEMIWLPEVKGVV